MLKILRGSPGGGVVPAQPFGGAMKRRLKIRKKMKTRILLTTLGVAALAAITINVNAGNALLSPRATGSQIKVGPAAADHNLVAENRSAAVSPRALSDQTTTVASVANDVNRTAACRNMTSSPKAIQACAANPMAAMPCCAKSVTVAK